MDDEKSQIAIRLSISLLSRLDAYRDRMQSEFPGMGFTRAAAIRVLLERGLADAGLPGEAGRARSERGRRRP